MASKIAQAAAGDGAGREVAASRSRRRWFWVVMASAGALVVMWLSHLPQGMVPADLGTGLGDKAPHAVVYGLLTLCWLKACGGGRPTRWVIAIVMVPIAIGTVDELDTATRGAIVQPDGLAGQCGGCEHRLCVVAGGQAARQAAFDVEGAVGITVIGNSAAFTAARLGQGQAWAELFQGVVNVRIKEM